MAETMTCGVGPVRMRDPAKTMTSAKAVLTTFRAFESRMRMSESTAAAPIQNGRGPEAREDSGEHGDEQRCRHSTERGKRGACEERDDGRTAKGSRKR